MEIKKQAIKSIPDRLFCKYHILFKIYDIKIHNRSDVEKNPELADIKVMTSNGYEYLLSGLADVTHGNEVIKTRYFGFFLKESASFGSM